jgi:hypothetical protein
VTENLPTSSRVIKAIVNLISAFVGCEAFYFAVARKFVMSMHGAYGMGEALACVTLNGILAVPLIFIIIYCVWLLVSNKMKAKLGISELLGSLVIGCVVGALLGWFQAKLELPPLLHYLLG